MKIQNSVHLISWTFFLIDQKMKKFITKPLPCSIDSRFLFDQSIYNIWLIERNSISIETMENFIIEFLPKSIGSQFLFGQLKRNIWLIERNSQLIETRKTEFLKEFSSNRFWQFFCYSLSKDTFWLYKWRFTNETGFQDQVQEP